MAKLTRIFTSGIGAGVARFSPLMVNFCNGEMTPEDSILWLRNGGGKTCWLALVYSIFRPRAQHFLLKKAKGKDCSIMDFVQANDLAYVITEWDDSDQATLMPDRRNLRVVGQLLAWKNGQKSDERARLKHLLFSFRCNDRLNLDGLPIMGISPDPVKSFDDFKDWLTEVQSRYPNLEITIPESLDDWEDHLIRIGFDPMLFQFQILMNQREGDIDQYFKDYCSSPQKFASEFLKMAFEPTKADHVSDNIVALRHKLSQREPLLREQEFIGSFLGALDPFLDEVASFKGAQSSLDAARQQGRGARDALARSIDVLQRQELDEAARLAEATERVKTTKEMIGTVRQQLGYARVCQSRLEVAGGASREAAAQEAVSHAEEHLRTCKAAGKLAEVLDLRNQETALQEALSRQNQREQPVLEVLRHRGAVLRELLRQQLLQIDLHLGEVAQQQNSLQTALKALRTQELNLTDQRGTLRQSQQQFQTRINQREVAYRSLLNHGVVEQHETAAAARERWETERTRLREDINRLNGIIEELEAERDRVGEELTRQAVEQTQLQGKKKELADFFNELERRQMRLEKDQFILDLTGGKQPDLEFPRILEGLKSRMVHVQQLLLQAAVDGAEDQRALKHLEQTGLLPPSLDVERAVEHLKEQGIPAFSALEYLACNVHDPEQALQLLLADPGKFSGIVVNNTEQIDKVRGLLNARSSLKGPVQVSPVALEPWPGEPDRVVLPPASSGTFNRPAAQDERAHIQARVTKQKATQEAYALEIEGIGRTIRELSEYLEGYVSRRAQARQEQDRVNEVAGLLSAAVAANKAKQIEIKQSIAGREKEIEEQEGAIDDLSEKIQRLTGFIRDHENEYESNKQQLASLGEQIAGISNELDRIAGDVDRAQQEFNGLASQETRHRVERTTVEGEHSKIQHYADGVADTSKDLSQARADYEAQLDVYNKISNTELHGRIKALKEQITRREREYRNMSTGLHAKKVEVLAKRPSLGTETQDAEQAHQRTVGDHAVAQAELRRLRAELGKLEQEFGNKTAQPADVGEPTSIEAAKQLHADLESRLRTLIDEETTAANEVSQHKHKKEECARGLSFRTDMQEALGGLELGTGDTTEVLLPAGEPQIRVLVKEIQRTVRDSLKRVEQSQARLDDRYGAIRAMLTKPDEPGCENAMKPKLLALSREALVQGAADIRENANTRRTIIQRDLEAIEQDRQGILTEMEIVYSQARHLLNSAERISRIPETIKAWANQPFLRIKLREVTPADSRARLQELLDAILKENSAPSGTDLAFRSIVQVSGEDGIDISILKPDIILRADRMPVESISYFSGGEGVTAAILLYCTLLQLRSQNYGKVTHTKDAGALMLDNPIGKCSRPDLLKMHREISHKMRVQLIYLTGVNDVSAIGTFDRIIRLKNQHKDLRTGDLHITVDDGGMAKAEMTLAPTHA